MIDGAQTPVYLGLGSNLGDRAEFLGCALDLLEDQIMIDQVSSVYETEPVGYPDQPWFLNIVCHGHTALAPHDLLWFAKSIERQLGRSPSPRDFPRVIDIDILLYGTMTLRTDELTIPHPRLHERAFVLTPLHELAPDLLIPGLNETVAHLLHRLPPSHEFRLWSPPLGTFRRAQQP